MDKIEAARLLIQSMGGNPDLDEAKKMAAVMLLEPPAAKPKVKPAEKAAPKKRGRPALDMGKLKALTEGGWSVAKIADEMGVSEMTIKQKQKELKGGTE